MTVFVFWGLCVMFKEWQTFDNQKWTSLCQHLSPQRQRLARTQNESIHQIIIYSCQHRYVIVISAFSSQITVKIDRFLFWEQIHLGQTPLWWSIWNLSFHHSAAKRRRLTRSKSDGGMEGCESTVYGLVLPYPSLGSVTIVTLFSLALQHRAKHFTL